METTLTQALQERGSKVLINELEQFDAIDWTARKIIEGFNPTEITYLFSNYNHAGIYMKIDNLTPREERVLLYSLDAKIIQGFIFVQC